jgi:autotransporter adhesin
VATGSVAVGAAASAANGGAAFGDGAIATGTNATAIGPGASATFANSSAFGNGAAATAANQMAFGTASNTYRMPGLTSAASLAAQSGPTAFVTTDANGNLAATSLSVPNISNLTANVAALQQGVNALQYDLQQGLHKANTGTAIALALGGMANLQPGRRFALSGGWGNFQGNNALGVGATGLLYDSKSYAVVLNAGVGFGVDTNVVGTRGVVSLQW